jgi:hypothetical protein
VVVKALLQNERLRVGGSLNFDFRNTFAKGSISTALFLFNLVLSKLYIAAFLAAGRIE